MFLWRISKRSDEALIAAVVENPAAFTAFYDRHLPKVLAYFRRRVAEPETAVDLAAETFARVLEHAGDFDATRGSAPAWLFGIARNLLVDSQRQQMVADAARRRLGMEAVELTDDDLRRVDELVEAANEKATKALERLPADQREAVWARIVLERDYDEIARDLDCSPSVVRQRVSRGVRAMRTHVAKETE